MRLLSILFLTCWACAAQSFTLGVLGGGRATDDVTSGATPESRRYVVGPTLEVGLPLGFALEFDALYHRHRYIWGTGNFAGFDTQLERANDWEFPLLAKYYLPVPKIKPFVVGGIAPRSLSGTIRDYGGTVNLQTGVITPFSGTGNTNWSASYGAIVGGGLRFSLGPLKLSPQVRFTHWTSTPINYISDQGFASATQQVDVLVGIGWKFR